MENTQNQQTENPNTAGQSPMGGTPNVIPAAESESTPSSSHPEFVPGSKKFSIKAIIGIIIFLLLAGGAAASFTVLKPQIMKLVSKPTPTPTVIPGSTRNPVTPTPDPTADWITHTTNEYTVKYPADFNIIPDSSSNWFQITNEPNPKAPGLYLSSQEDNKYFEIDITVEPAKGKTVTEIANGFDRFQNRKNYSRNRYNLGGIDGYIVTDVSLDSLTDLVFVVKSDKIYSLVLRYFPETKNIEEGKKIFAQILSTYKFTGSQTLINPTPTCIKRPACLDAAPRCMIAEPASGWCP